MRRFEHAIKVLKKELLCQVGKVVMSHEIYEKDPFLALRESKVKNLKEAIKILEDHVRNNHY